VLAITQKQSDYYQKLIETQYDANILLKPFASFQ